MRGLGVAATSATRTEIASLVRQLKLAMARINVTSMPDGARRGAIESYNQLITDAEVLSALGNDVVPADFREFKQNVQGFLAFAMEPESFGITPAAPTSPLPSPAERPVITAVPSSDLDAPIDPARSYLIWGGVAVGAVALVGLGLYGRKKGWFRRKGRR